MRTLEELQPNYGTQSMGLVLPQPLLKQAEERLKRAGFAPRIFVTATAVPELIRKLDEPREHTAVAILIIDHRLVGSTDLAVLEDRSSLQVQVFQLENLETKGMAWEPSIWCPRHEASGDMADLVAGLLQRQSKPKPVPA